MADSLQRLGLLLLFTARAIEALSGSEAVSDVSKRSDTFFEVAAHGNVSMLHGSKQLSREYQHEDNDDRSPDDDRSSVEWSLLNQLCSFSFWWRSCRLKKNEESRARIRQQLLEGANQGTWLTASSLSNSETSDLGDLFRNSKGVRFCEWRPLALDRDKAEKCRLTNAIMGSSPAEKQTFIRLHTDLLREDLSSLVTYCQVESLRLGRRSCVQKLGRIKQSISFLMYAEQQDLVTRTINEFQDQNIKQLTGGKAEYKDFSEFISIDKLVPSKKTSIHSLLRGWSRSPQIWRSLTSQISRVMAAKQAKVGNASALPPESLEAVNEAAEDVESTVAEVEASQPKTTGKQSFIQVKFSGTAVSEGLSNLEQFHAHMAKGWESIAVMFTCFILVIIAIWCWPCALGIIGGFLLLFVLKIAIVGDPKMGVKPWINLHG